MLQDCFVLLISHPGSCFLLRFPFRWLNNPQFVGSFETEDHVYFLFRESAVEYINCGKVRSIPYTEEQIRRDARAFSIIHPRHARSRFARAISDLVSFEDFCVRRI